MDELLRQISSRELSEWIAFASLEPIGDERGDWQAALVASVVAEAARDRKRRRKPFAPKEFLLTFESKQRQKQGWDEQLQIVEMLNVAFGGRDLRNVSTVEGKE